MAIICSNCGGSNYDENSVCLDCGFFVNGLPAGTLLDNRYQILEAIKAGGMGAVYLGFDNRLQQTCAVKEMFNNAGGTPEQNEYIIKRFMEEAKLLAGLNHPSIPRVIDYFNEDGNKYYLVMDYIEGRDLYTYVFDEGGTGLGEELVLEWGIEVCDVLHYLHSQPHPILHRDLKPSNLILRDSDKRLMLIDFGLARAINLHSHTQKTVVGTLGYAPMEQYQGHPEPRSDLYSLGATMHFLLTAQESMPFKFPPLREIKEDISEWMERFIQKALSLKPENRYASAEEMYLVLTGEVPLESLVFSPDDSIDVDISVIQKEKPALRSFRISGGIRQAEEHYVDLDAKKIISMAKTTKDKKLVEPLINIMNSDPYDENRRGAAKSLGDIEDERAIEPLIEALNQKDEHVRTNAAWSLGKIGSSRTAEPLFSLYVNDKTKIVRNEARNALIELGKKRQGGEEIRFLLDLIDQASHGYKEILPENSALYFASLEELLIQFIKDSDRFPVRFHLGVAYYYNGYLKDALRHFERALKLSEKLPKKNLPEVLYFMGKVFEKTDLFKAIDAYEEALKLEPSYGEAQSALISANYEIAQRDAQRGNLALELEVYSKIISDFPEHKETSFIRGLLFMKQKNTKEAIKYFTKYIEENPKGKRLLDAGRMLEELQKNIFSKFFSRLTDAFKKK